VAARRARRAPARRKALARFRRCCSGGFRVTLGCWRARAGRLGSRREGPAPPPVPAAAAIAATARRTAAAAAIAATARRTAAGALAPASAVIPPAAIAIATVAIAAVALAAIAATIAAVAALGAIAAVKLTAIAATIAAVAAVGAAVLVGDREALGPRGALGGPRRVLGGALGRGHRPLRVRLFAGRHLFGFFSAALRLLALLARRLMQTRHARTRAKRAEAEEDT
jgi:hypothetical protein